MKFYNQTSELAELKRIQNLSFNENSRLTVVTGRRPILAKEGTQAVRYKITDNFIILLRIMILSTTESGR